MRVMEDPVELCVDGGVFQGAEHTVDSELALHGVPNSLWVLFGMQ